MHPDESLLFVLVCANNKQTTFDSVSHLGTVAQTCASPEHTNRTQVQAADALTSINKPGLLTASRKKLATFSCSKLTVCVRCFSAAILREMWATVEMHIQTSLLGFENVDLMLLLVSVLSGISEKFQRKIVRLGFHVRTVHLLPAMSKPRDEPSMVWSRAKPFIIASIKTTILPWRRDFMITIASPGKPSDSSEIEMVRKNDIIILICGFRRNSCHGGHLLVFPLFPKKSRSLCRTTKWVSSQAMKVEMEHGSEHESEHNCFV